MRSSSLEWVVDQREVLLGALAQVHQERRVAAVVQDHVGALARRALGTELEDAVGVVPVILQRLALDGEHRRAAGGDGGGGVVLRREDVARGPAHRGAQGLQRLDQHGGLDRHVQAAGDARALQRLAGGELLADRHQAGHLGFGDPDFLAAPGGQADVGDGLVGGGDGSGIGGRSGFENSAHEELQSKLEKSLPRSGAGRKKAHRGAAGERGCEGVRASRHAGAATLLGGADFNAARRMRGPAIGFADRTGLSRPAHLGSLL